MPEKVVHRLAEIIRFRMLVIAAGYEDGNDAGRLRSDPMFKLALDRLPSGEDLCPQSVPGLDPGISRLENLPDLRALARRLPDHHRQTRRGGIDSPCPAATTTTQTRAIQIPLSQLYSTRA
jgi:hypothetical protein